MKDVLEVRGSDPYGRKLGRVMYEGVPRERAWMCLVEDLDW